MGLVTGVTKQVEIPHEPNEWMVLRKLSWKQLEAASDVKTAAQLEQMKRLGGDLISAMQKAAGDRQQAPGDAYDRAVVLAGGIVQWSYEPAVSGETIYQLDEETAAWAFREILGLNAPRTDDERLNGSSPSTSA